jgi:hypothetical protein
MSKPTVSERIVVIVTRTLWLTVMSVPAVLMAGIAFGHLPLNPWGWITAASLVMHWMLRRK